ncbi:MAG: hypothetical protein K8H90_05255, partial [Thermoanaerobaculia bacterium]|nr:hypothetical protein [Thermoanaerobaculia bacterium]
MHSSERFRFFACVLSMALAAVPAWASAPLDHQHPADTEGLEGLTDPPVRSLVTPYLTAKQHGARLYFLYDAPARVECYDLGAQAWLPMILLPPGPTAFDIDAIGLYVAFGQSVYAFETDGTGQRFLRSESDPVQELFAFGSRLLVVEASHVSSLDVATGAVIDEEDIGWSWRGTSFDGAAIFGRTTSVSPADILRMGVELDGTLGPDDDSPYHGDFPSATRTFALPGIGAVVD